MGLFVRCRTVTLCWCFDLQGYGIVPTVRVKPHGFVTVKFVVDLRLRWFSTKASKCGHIKPNNPTINNIDITTIFRHILAAKKFVGTKAYTWVLQISLWLLLLIRCYCLWGNTDRWNLHGSSMVLFDFSRKERTCEAVKRVASDDGKRYSSLCQSTPLTPSTGLVWVTLVGRLLVLWL